MYLDEMKSLMRRRKKAIRYAYLSPKIQANLFISTKLGGTIPILCVHFVSQTH